MERRGQFYAKSQKIANIMSCNLCNNLLTEATKIINCFHTFCKECIYTKIREEEIECCPVCRIYLGVNPFINLRPDFNLQDMRNHLFPVGKEEEARKYLPIVLMHASGHKPNMKAGSSSLTSKLKNKKNKRDIIQVEEEKVPSRLYPKEETIFGAASILPQAFFFNDDNLPPNYEVWTFKLRALNKVGSPPLPQITSCYAQMRNLSVPISYIYKFLSKKLGFEVAITCMGIPVLPTTTTDELIQFWLNTNEKNEGTIDDRLRVHLYYGRKVSSPSS